MCVREIGGGGGAQNIGKHQFYRTDEPFDIFINIQFCFAAFAYDITCTGVILIHHLKKLSQTALFRPSFSLVFSSPLLSLSRSLPLSLALPSLFSDLISDPNKAACVEQPPPARI